MKYFKVTCIRGHQGTRQNKRLIDFYFIAHTGYDAMKMGQKMRGVKHDKLPVACVPVSEEEYKQMIRVSAYERCGAK